MATYRVQVQRHVRMVETVWVEVEADSPDSEVVGNLALDKASDEDYVGKIDSEYAADEGEWRVRVIKDEGTGYTLFD